MNPYATLGCHMAPFGPGRPDAFFEAESHAEALATVRLAFHAGWPGVLVVGGAGLGKTFLAELLAVEAARSAHTAILCGADCSNARVDVCAARPDGADWRRIAFAEWRDAQPIGSRSLLIVDDAHLVPKAFWDSVLALLARPAAHTTLVLLSGSEAIEPRLVSRIRRRTRLEPFCPAEAAGYISFRLGAAGARGVRFNDEAAEFAHTISGGVPRALDHVCDNALLEAMAERRSVVLARDVKAGAAASGFAIPAIEAPKRWETAIQFDDSSGAKKGWIDPPRPILVAREKAEFGQIVPTRTERRGGGRSRGGRNIQDGRDARTTQGTDGRDARTTQGATGGRDVRTTQHIATPRLATQSHVSPGASPEELELLERRLSTALKAVREERARRARLPQTPRGSIRLGRPAQRVFPSGDWWVNAAEARGVEEYASNRG
ncbi:MAG: hypothetical protein KDA32_01400 [Phycisphaerales bacterium]|nr:hypothetical protein [Phycisphaerales bacterium]